MTRRKYIKLRRDRPELFKQWGRFGTWETLSDHDRNIILRTSKRIVIQVMSERLLSGAAADYMYIPKQGLFCR